ncbi:hypothetical protein CYY_000879 [Polysphondylium violaceum]|uniref:Exonuclease domain-containing protein n=1 Tax=Polysphondylium violaceum TaxID=133409 RepID=A0A8J4VB50_9MYCE|nr:hypothetical protein CYY_000879 [Polysphondylium violaceum]
MSNTERSQRILWVDLEMTGLDLKKDAIIEMACIITDKDLNIIEKGPDIVIHQSDELLNSMDDWCTKTHGGSGLTKKVQDSKISTKEAEQIMVDFVKKHIDKRTVPLAGNSIGTDRNFLEKEMPLFSQYFHYRVIDVSSIKECAKRWFPNILKQSPQKQNTHRALDDIEESIQELKYYRSSLFPNKDIE